MIFPLSTCNELKQVADKLYTLTDIGDETFHYSDGSAHEIYLHEVLTQAKDLGSDSQELENHIRDWPSEYHLSPKRAHILRALNLEGIETALEVGSGCGAISRYLVEQGMQLDSIEGSPVRAKLTTLRCRELERLHVVNANFNRLKLPGKRYDAVFFIGVLEYARRFLPESNSDEEAVISMLSKAFDTLSDDGIIVVAIENRIGFKYLAGATEDHFGVANIGIHGYPQDDSDLNARKFGIHTYDKGEWQSLLGQIPGVEYAFGYPFPDYKIADIALSDAFVRNNRYAYSLAARTSSRDYRAHWQPCLDEAVFWETASAAGTLEQYANSFLLVLSKSTARIGQVVDKDFINFPNRKRKPEYRVSVYKPASADIVRRRPTHTGAHQSPRGVASHVLDDEPWFPGHLLARKWRNTLELFHEPAAFDKQIKQYYRFLDEYLELPQHQHDGLDVTPFNIIVDEAGEFHVFDKEWRTEDTLSPGLVFFRAMLYYALIEKHRLARYFEQREIRTLGEFVKHCFDVVEQKPDFEAYVAWEDRFQAQVLLADKVVKTGERLALPATDNNIEYFYPHVYWQPVGDEDFSQCVVSRKLPLSSDTTTIDINLPAVALHTELIRFDPIDHQTSFDGGCIQIFTIQVMQTAADGTVTELTGFDTPLAIAQACTFVNLDPIAGEGESGFFAPTSNDPQVLFPVKEPRSGDTKTISLRVKLRLFRPHQMAHALSAYSEALKP
ncbi:MAG: hypothetical protein DSZ32_05680 [Gammaproteobacteria bacterium]|nr:MAG: hypothetical protein DSZ32_05680 [Gammaproteobacteria bacterium]